MSGMQQNGANTILNLGTLTLAGEVEGDAGTTLQIATPYAKEGDCIALSMSQQLSGAVEGLSLTEYYATDGFLNFTFIAASEATVELNGPIEIGLLRSPGFPGAVTGIGSMGLRSQESTATPEPGPGPALPLFPFAGIESTAFGTLDPADSAIIAFPALWPAPPPSQGGQLPIALNIKSAAPAGLAITGWRNVNNLLELNVRNVTAAPIAIGAGAFAVAGFAVGGRATPNTQRTSAQGGSQSGPIRGWYARKPCVSLSAAGPGEFELPLADSAGNLVVNPVPNTVRFVASSIRGLTQAGGAVHLMSLPHWTTGDVFSMQLYAEGALELAAGQVQCNLWTWETHN